MIIPAQTLRQLKPVEPFVERTRHHGMTFGLSPAGYDIRIAQDVKLSRLRSFVLASSVERFVMPADLIAQVCDKSSWARRGVAVQNTIIEPGWRGYLTLELTYARWWPIRIKAGSPIAQIIFFRLEAPTEQPYAGKYQDQRAGPVPAIITPMGDV
jgi:dCTP deaminase